MSTIFNSIKVFQSSASRTFFYSREQNPTNYAFDVVVQKFTLLSHSFGKLWKVFLRYFELRGSASPRPLLLQVHIMRLR